MTAARIIPLALLLLPWVAHAQHTDRDGMPDAYEVAHGLDAATDDLALDLDADALSNGLEYFFVTDPQLPNRSPVEVRREGGSLVIRYPRRKGFLILGAAPETSGDLVAWSRPTVTTTVSDPGAGSEFMWVEHTFAPGNPSRQFVRLALEIPTETFHIIFATEDVFSIASNTNVPPSGGTFGGLAAADYTCTFKAWGVGLVTDWDFVTPIWKALLSDSTETAKERIVITGPVYNTNGDLIAHDTDDLWDGSLHNAVGFDEHGNAIPAEDAIVWTGTGFNGTASATCEDWVVPTSGGGGTTGFATDSSFSAFGASTRACSESHRLYAVSPPLDIFTAQALLGLE